MGLCSKPALVETPIPPITKFNVAQVLQLNYENKIAPVERRHDFEHWYTPPLMPGEFKAKPMVLFLGQYSVGKTTMIKYLLGQKEYPGTRIGPEPTTDCFVVIHHGTTEKTTMGMTLAADGTMPFQSLNIFGGAFLTHLRGATLDVPLLKHVYFIDTPGILSGQNQTISREYNFANVTRFIADKVDLIVLLFDTSKLDISDEYKLVLQNLKGNEEKIKIVLNKADSVDPGELVRVRGALMWSLSKIIDTPEVPKVYIGSFDGRAAKNSEILDLFKEDYVELFKELQRLPSQLLARRVNDIIKRAKNVRIHALLMDEIMRGMWYKSDSQLKKQLKDEKLKGVFTEVKQRFRLADSDMPKYEAFKESAKSCPLRLWNKVDTPMLVKLEEFLMKDVAKILEHMPEDEGDTDSFKKAFRDLLLQQNIEIPEEKKKEDDKDKEKADGEKKEE